MCRLRAPCGLQPALLAFTQVTPACMQSGSTALHLAAQRGFGPCVHLLLTHPRVDVHAKDKVCYGCGEVTWGGYARTEIRWAGCLGAKEEKDRVKCRKRGAAWAAEGVSPFTCPPPRIPRTGALRWSLRKGRTLWRLSRRESTLVANVLCSEDWYCDTAPPARRGESRLLFFAGIFFLACWDIYEPAQAPAAQYNCSLSPRRKGRAYLDRLITLGLGPSCPRHTFKVQDKEMGIGWFQVQDKERGTFPLNT